MNREPTLITLKDMFEPNGGIAITWGQTKALDPANDYDTVASEIIRKYLGERRRAGSGYYAPPEERHEEVVARHFGRLEIVGEDGAFNFRNRRTVEGVLGLLYSTSFASPYLFGDQLDAFERDIGQALLQLQPSGVFEEMVTLGAILAWVAAS